MADEPKQKPVQGNIELATDLLEPVQGTITYPPPPPTNPIEEQFEPLNFESRDLPSFLDQKMIK